MVALSLLAGTPSSPSSSAIFSAGLSQSRVLAGPAVEFGGDLI